MKKKTFSIVLATIVSLSSINSVYGVSVNAVENFTVGLSELENSSVIKGEDKSDVTAFDELLTMSENELMKFCEVNGFVFVSQEVIKSDLQSSGNFFLRINPKKYHLNDSDDVCIAENISDINKYNVNEYDFDKMISELNLPEKYYNITLDSTPFMICMESVPTESGSMKQYFIKLANLKITVNSEFAQSDLSLRLYQLIRILPHSNSSFHSVSVQYSGSSDTSKSKDIFPKTTDEYEAFLEKYGNVSVHGKYIVYCGEVNFSTGAKLIVNQSGTAEIKEYKHYSISDNSIGVGGSTSKIVYIYEAITPGKIKVSFLAGRPWGENTGDKEIIGYYEIGDDFTIVKKNELPEIVNGDVNSDGEFGVADVVILEKWLLGTSNDELINLEVTDLCQDGQLDVFDLCLMKEMLIEKMNESSINS